MTITRSVDDLGRICIPKEMRKTLGITAGTECNVNLIGNRIVISNAANTCTICNKPADIKVAENHYICKNCAKKIIEGVEKND